MLGAACGDAEAAGCLLILMSHVLMHHMTKQEESIVGQIVSAKSIGFTVRRERDGTLVGKMSDS